jgi:hypothetical protein
MPHEGRGAAKLGSSTELLDQCGLADPGRARHEDQPGGALARGVVRVEQLGHLAPAPDEPGDRVPNPRRRRRHIARRREVEVRPLQQDVHFEAPEVVRRRDTEILVEATCECGVRTQRFRLPAGAVQRAHVARREPFAKWELRQRGAHHVDHERVLSEREPRLGQLLDGDGSELFQTCDLAARNRSIGDLGERGAAPQVEGVRELRDRLRRVAPAYGLAREQDQPLEALRVELGGFDRQHVAPRAGPKARARSVGTPLRLECLAKAAHVNPERGCRARWGAALPELLDQMFAGVRPVRSKCQECEQLSGFRPT